MGIYRSLIVWGTGIVVLMVPFLIFVAAGWPGSENCCIYDPAKPCSQHVLSTKNSCYCEAFTPAEVKAGKPGVRQPVNTWFNLYSIVTSLLVAVVVFLDRKAGGARNTMQSDSWIPDLYVFAVLFLGLGSMWFHASLKEWGGIFDGLSMYVYAAFLVFYTIHRLWIAEWFFWIFYLVTVVAFTVAGALWEWELKSLILILILVVAYLVFEVIIWARTARVMQGRLVPILLWLGAVVCIVAATIFWALSQTGGPLCDPKSAFQPHGLLWHPLAGCMAVLLYFYWREEEHHTGYVDDLRARYA
jgi:Ceramidase